MYSTILSSSFTLEHIKGWFNSSTRVLINLWFGILIPISFLLELNILEILLFAFNINVNGPGSVFLRVLKIFLSNGLVYLEISFKSWQIKEKLAFVNLIFLIFLKYDFYNPHINRLYYQKK